MGIAHKRKEENMKKMKKILAMLLAVVMVMGMSLTVFAEESGTTTGTKPTDGDKLSASVTNIKQEGVTVKAYQVVKANYNDNGFTGYSWVDATGDNYHTAAEKKYVAKATRRRRRILQSRILCSYHIITVL